MATPYLAGSGPGDIAATRFNVAMQTFGAVNPRFAYLYDSAVLTDTVAQNIMGSDGMARPRTLAEMAAMVKRAGGPIQEVEAVYYFLTTGAQSILAKGPTEGITIRDTGALEKTPPIACPRWDGEAHPQSYSPGGDPAGFLEAAIANKHGEWAQYLNMELFYRALINGKFRGDSLLCYDGLSLWNTAHKCNTKDPKVTGTYSNSLEITQKEGEGGWRSLKKQMLEVTGWDGVRRIHANVTKWRIVVADAVHSFWWEKFIGVPNVGAQYHHREVEVPNAGAVSVTSLSFGDAEIVVDPYLNTWAEASQEEYAYVFPQNGDPESRLLVKREGGTPMVHTIDKQAENNCLMTVPRAFMGFGAYNPRAAFRVRVKR